MSKHLLISFIGLLAVALALAQNQPADAAFHIMRVWEVMGGAFGNSTIQYVELRMPSPTQNFVNTHEICFFDAAGTAKARLAFTADAPLGPDGASILIGTSEFDAVWAAGSPDYIIGGTGSTMTALNGGDALHPVQIPGGKVGFGDYSASCGTPSVVDSLAYGVSGTVTADPCCNNGGAGGKFASDLPTSGTQAIKLTGEFCHPSAFDGSTCAMPPNNAVDYSIVDANVTANNPRNNGGLSGPLAQDTDGDGVLDGSDNCMTTANAFQGNQDSPADTLGDACDPDSDNDGDPNSTDPDDDNDKVFDIDEGECRDDVDGPDANTLVNDGCPQIGPTGESGAQCTSSTDSDADGYINDGCPGMSEPVACGGDPLSPARSPERLDTIGDDDGDGATNEALPAGSSTFDCDGDGWKGNQENLIYNDAPGTGRDQDPCGNNGWGSDLTGASNTLNIADIGSFLSPARGVDDGHGTFNKFSHTLDDTAPFNGVSGIEATMARWNLATPPHDGITAINIADLNSLLTGAVGSPARPPMFGGQQAFFTSGGVCPFPA
jgi:hypothetical protein